LRDGFEFTPEGGRIEGSITGKKNSQHHPSTAFEAGQVAGDYKVVRYRTKVAWRLFTTDAPEFETK
jgi:hypothetical protein